MRWLLGSQFTSCRTSGKVEEAQSLSASNSIALTICKENNTTLQTLLGNANAEVIGLKTEIGPLKEIASRLFTNAPATKQLDLLYELVQSITNTLTKLEPVIAFKLSVNGTILTNGPVMGDGVSFVGINLMPVIIKKDRTIEITAFNMGSTTVEGIQVGAYFDTVESNIIPYGWSRQPPFKVTSAGQTRMMAGFSTRSENILTGAAEGFLAAPILVSTNYSYQVLPAFIRVQFPRSKLFDFYCLFVLQP